jgi:signal transduction histidine kinase
MGKPLRLLLVEDSPEDADLLLAELARGGYDVECVRVETADAMRTALARESWDIILCDYSLPAFTGPGALGILKDSGLDVPLIIVSGTIGEEAAVAALRAGARDFLVKHHLARLIPAIERELREAEVRRQRAHAHAALEEQVRQAQKMEAIGQLAGGIAHDFNNLLTAILGYCELLTEQIGPDKPIGRDLQEIASAARSAASMTRQLLAFSRRQVLTVAALDLNGVVGRLETMLRRLLGEHITVATKLAPDLHPVMADATQLEQVLINLSVNARDAMPQGGMLTISTGNVVIERSDGANRVDGLAPGSYVTLSVADTGTGIPAAVKGRIFEPFFTTKERGRGTGLGLAAVHGIVTQLGGAIGVESAVGAGTTFRVFLPATHVTIETKTEPVRQGTPVGSETVLLVEDERGVRTFIATALRRFGYRVIEAESAETALAQLAGIKEPIHMLLTDVILPKMNGRALADQIKRIYPAMPVLFMSGYTEQMTTAQGFLEPGVHLLEKPFTVQALFAKIREILASPEPEPQ